MEVVEKYKGVVKQITREKIIFEITHTSGLKELRSFDYYSMFEKENINLDDEYSVTVKSGHGSIEITFDKIEKTDPKYFTMFDDDDAITEDSIKRISEINKNIEIIERAKRYAIKCHRETNHLYDGKPYEFHLNMVVEFGEMFIGLIPNNKANAIGGLWTHDVQEDCRQTFNDVKEATNEEIAEMSYALSNEKGKNRSERANAKYYRGIRKKTVFVWGKLCDRLGNVKYSLMKHIQILKEKDSGENKYKNGGEIQTMFMKYKKENPKFIWSLIKPEWYEIHQHVLHLFMGHKNYVRYRKSSHQLAPMILLLENLLNQK